jgi:hypothetical protein
MVRMVLFAKKPERLEVVVVVDRPSLKGINVGK